ncbi:MAG: thiamine pyrophosphate-binding protein [Isosphaeraceae bacterium]|nr:thiamine pyrophosphate-binding protein [Isosphaeraceae bacterium]
MSTVRVADYLAAQIPRLGVDHVFAVTGGGAMHLDDALRLRQDVQVVFNQHEQACSIAAEGYARTSGTLGIAVVTSGPGGTNCITGVLGMWHDSVPALFLSGQVRFDTTVASTGLPLRQLGDQENDIVRLVAPITKYAAMITDPLRARYHLEKAVYLALNGRPGPVWLDVPLNVQAARVDPEDLIGFDPDELEGLPDRSIQPLRGQPITIVEGLVAPDEMVPESPSWPRPYAAPSGRGAAWGHFDRDLARGQAEEVIRRLRIAERPVFLAGSALRSSGAVDDFRALADTLGLPVTTAWNALDVMWQDHPLFIGRPGTIGDRAGNFAVQNADLLLVLGCRLNVRQIGYEFPAFARAAHLVVVDIDAAELAKPTISPDLAVHADVGWFVRTLRELAATEPVSTARAAWLSWCSERRARYPIVLPEYREREAPVNPYVFIDELSDQLDPDDIVVLANGAACVTALQALRLKRGQRVIVNSGTAGMGYDLPAAIGAACARRAGPSDKRRVVCLAGDGSIQMNLQELETVVHYGLPVKIFVFNNGGYLSMRLTQDNLFGGARFGESSATGVGLPNMLAVAEAFGLAANRVDNHAGLSRAIADALAANGPSLLDVVMDPEQGFAPKVIAEKLPDGTIVSKPLEDMFPWLDREELRANMVVPVYNRDARENT